MAVECGYLQDADMEVDPARSEVTIKWTICNATKLCREKEALLSPIYYVGNVGWLVGVVYSSNNLLPIIVCLLPKDDDSWSCTIRALHQIVSFSADPIPKLGELPEIAWTCKECRIWVYPKSDLKKDFVLNPQNGYIKDDTIAFEVHFIIEPSNYSLNAQERKDLCNGEEEKELPLIQAIRQEDSEKCTSLIGNNESVNTEDRNGRTPLMWAAYKGDLNIVTKLIKAKAEINAADCFGYSPLMRAAERGHKDVVEFLLNRGAEVDFSTKGCLRCNGSMRLTALHFAAHDLDNRMDIAKILIERGADITAISTENAVRLMENNASTTIVWCMANKKFELMETLLQMSKIKIKDIDVNGSSLLIHAIRRGCLESVKFLVENGANPCKRDKNGDAPLLVAVLKHQAEIVDFLLENGARLMVHSALYFAILNKNLEMAGVMIGNGANVNLIAEDKYTPLTMAIELNTLQLVELLIENKSDVNFVDKNNCAPLSAAISNNNAEIIQLLLQSGADPNIIDNDGSTPLLKCIERGNFERVTLLLKHGADVNFIDRKGRTPLMAAVDEENPRILKFLMGNGADLTLSLEAKEKIVSKALETDNWISLTYIMEAGVDLSSCQDGLDKLAEKNLDFAMYLADESKKGKVASVNCSGDHEEASWQQ